MFFILGRICCGLVGGVCAWVMCSNFGTSTNVTIAVSMVTAATISSLWE